MSKAVKIWRYFIRTSFNLSKKSILTDIWHLDSNVRNISKRKILYIKILCILEQHTTQKFAFNLRNTLKLQCLIKQTNIKNVATEYLRKPYHQLYFQTNNKEAQNKNDQLKKLITQLL